MAYSEPTHPPIFPPGLHQMAIETLEETFVAPEFDTPLRRRLTTQLRLFVGVLANLGVHGDIWIDGSCVTKKPDPRDVDVALSMTPMALRALSDEHQRRLAYYGDERGRSHIRSRWQVDFYVFNSTNRRRYEYFRALFANNPDQANQKGIPFIRL